MNLTKRILIFGYGVACYAVFFVTFLYAAGFVGGLVVPRSIDSEPTMAFWPALGINLVLLGIFAVQHSVMARTWFKRWWTRWIPQEAERSTYVLFSSGALIALFALWQPMGGVVWHVGNAVERALLYGAFGFGWILVLVTTFLINHFDLFGLRQVWLCLRGRAYEPLKFVTPGPYRIVRHPLYVGWLFAFWATPTMTIAHFVFAVATTIYILLAIRWEERDLIEHHGEAYAAYQRSVPMLVPRAGRRHGNAEAVVTTGR